MAGNIGDFGDVLECEFAGWDQDKGMDCFYGWVDHLDKGDGACGGFAGACFGAGDDVATGKNVGKSFFLNRGQLDVLNVL